jgi:hypothetical protein
MDNTRNGSYCCRKTGSTPCVQRIEWKLGDNGCECPALHGGGCISRYFSKATPHHIKKAQTKVVLAQFARALAPELYFKPVIVATELP